MERYTVKHEIGQGSFGTVFLAINNVTGTKVAIKRVKGNFQHWKSVMSLREVQAMVGITRTARERRQQRRHRGNQSNEENNDHIKNIVQTYEVLRESNGTLHVVFEYMPDGNLNDFLSNKRAQGHRTIDVSIIRSIAFQVVNGLRFIHSKGYVHRDIKPENLLMCGTKCKVADFSLTRLVSSKVYASGAHGRDAVEAMTTYVSTRWYRAPEVILGAPYYSIEVDMFAMGCVLAELYSLAPLFPGKGELDQLHRILELMGALHLSWPDGLNLPRRLGFKEEEAGNTVIDTITIAERLQKRMPTACPTAISLAMYLLQVDPKRRLSADDALQHAFFAAREEHNFHTSSERKRKASTQPPIEEEKHSSSSTMTPPRATVDTDMIGRVASVTVSPTFRNSSRSLSPLSSFVQDLNDSVDIAAPSHAHEKGLPLDEDSYRRGVKRSFLRVEVNAEKHAVSDTSNSDKAWASRSSTKKVACTPAEVFDVD